MKKVDVYLLSKFQSIADWMHSRHGKTNTDMARYLILPMVIVWAGYHEESSLAWAALAAILEIAIIIIILISAREVDAIKEGTANKYEQYHYFLRVFLVIATTIGLVAISLLPDVLSIWVRLHDILLVFVFYFLSVQKNPRKPTYKYKELLA